MRSFEERKEEIFLRSEKRIKQRKKTVKRVVLSCVPLVLCVTVLSGYLALGGVGRSDMSAPESAFEPNYMVQDSDYAYSNGSPAPELADAPESVAFMQPVSVQVKRNSLEQTYTDTDTLQRLESLLPMQGLMEDGDNANSPESGEGIPDEETAYRVETAFTLTVTYESGRVVTYTVTSNFISGPESIRTLNREQLQWLEELCREETP